VSKFLIIDGNSLIHRAFHAIPPLSTSTGLPTNAVLGFTNMLLKVLEAEAPDRVAVAFDKGLPAFRHEVFTGYKAHRPATPEDLRPQLALAKEVLEAMRIQIIEVEGYEADDIIGTLTRIAAEKKMDTLVLTGDQDTLQLVDKHNRVMLTRKGITELDVYDTARVIERFGLTPAQLTDMKGLVGDASDNIPGVPGIGFKTAAKLLQSYHSLEELLANKDQLPLRLRQQLEKYADQAVLSKQLATIERAVPGLDEDTIQEWPGPDYEALLKVFSKLEFKSLARNIAQRVPRVGDASELQVLTPVYQKVIDAEELSEVVRKTKNAGQVYIAFGGNKASGLEALSMAVEGTIFYLPFGKLKPEGQAIVQEMLEDPDVAKFTANGKDAYWFCHLRGIRLAGLAFDTTVAAYLIKPGAGGLTLEDLSLEYLHLALPDGGEKALPARTECIRRLVPFLETKLRMLEQEELFNEIEMPLVSVLARMEIAGVKVDRKQLTAMSEEFGQQIARLENEICALAGEHFNISSPRQLGNILFGKLGLPKGRKTKTGYSTDANVLEELAEEHEIVAKVLEYRQLVKLKGTYTDGLAALIDPRTLCLHTTLHQTVTATGRLSSAEPNLQNIPVRLEIGRRIRKVFVPSDPANVLLTADYSQIELRVLAHLSGDPALISAFREGQDIHTRTAAEVFGVPMEEVTPELRRRAKAVNFGIIYGISDFGLARDLRIPRREAAEYIRRYFARLPRVKEFIESTISQARNNGYVTTIRNRRRNIPELFSPNRTVRSFAERVATNSPIQGSAADIIKMAMVRIDRRLQEGRYKSAMILQVHDELIFDVPTYELCEVAPLIKQEMEQVVQLNVPLVVDLKVGPNWYDVRKIEEVTKCLNYQK